MPQVDESVTKEHIGKQQSDFLNWLQDKLEDEMKKESYNDAIVGVDTKGYLVYDYQKIVDVFTKEPHNMEYEEAIEFTDFNVVGLDGNGNWTIMYNREYYV